MNLDRNKSAEQRLLVLTPTGADSRLAVELLKRCGFNAEPCDSGERLCQEIGSGVGALIVADEALTPELVTQITSFLESQPTMVRSPRDHTHAASKSGEYGSRVSAGPRC